MKYVNETGMPWPFEEAVRVRPYTKGKADFSATELLQPPRLRELRRLHRDEIVVDVADQMYSLFGTVTHKILEMSVHHEVWSLMDKLLELKYEPGKGTRLKFVTIVNLLWKALKAYYQNERVVIERRLFLKIDGFVISGQIDLIYPDTVITDYKTMSIYEGMAGLKPEKIAQLNIYNLLGRYGVDEDGVKADIRARQLHICAMYRDWSKRKAFLAQERGDNYPPKQIAIFKVDKWTYKKTAEFIRDRIELHLAAQKELPECTPEERWQVPPKFAVRGEKRKAAFRVLDSKAEAIEWMEQNGKGDYIEERPGESIRCKYGYCDVAPFCEQWAKIQRQEETGG